jgi:isopenicillin N synthase-like dioxygenase
MTDIASVSLERPLAELADELGRSFAEYGFAVVRDHGIPVDLIARAEEKSREFFALPEAVKMQYHLKGKGGARGYTPFGIERAKDAAVHDLKEFWHVGRTLPPAQISQPYVGQSRGEVSASRRSARHDRRASVLAVALPEDRRKCLMRSATDSCSGAPYRRRATRRRHIVPARTNINAIRLLGARKPGLSC